jgi:AraC-like DNA-binding protein
VELIQVTPYIRFANILRFEQVRGPSKTYDCRFLYTFSGSATLILAGQEYRMQKGALAIFQPGCEYVIMPHSPLTLAVFDFDYTQSYHDTSDYLVPCAPALFQPEQEHEQIHFSDAPALNQPFYHPNVTFLETEISEIISEFQVKKIFFREKNSTQFKNLLINLIRHQQLGNIHNDVVRQVVEYIDRHPTGRISNAQIGLELNYNPNYLNKLMIRHTGMALHQYVLQSRLDYAMALLHTTERSVNDIALELGFHSLSHFSNYFKKQTGTSPALYRRAGMP